MQIKSRKKLTEKEAEEKIEQLAMQIQNETEFYIINLLPNLNKDFMDIDNATRFCLVSGGYTSIEQAIADTKLAIENIQWKITEDYARFLSPGIHTFVTGLVIKKREVTSKDEQLSLF